MSNVSSAQLAIIKKIMVHAPKQAIEESVIKVVNQISQISASHAINAASPEFLRTQYRFI